MPQPEWLPPIADAPEKPRPAPSSMPPPGFEAPTARCASTDANADPLAGSGESAQMGDWIGGVLLSLLVPVVGLIAGAVYVAKGGEKRQVGVMCLALSSVAFLGWLIVVGTSSGGSY